jgi:hypothetical protein
LMQQTASSLSTGVTATFFITAASDIAADSLQSSLSAAFSSGPLPDLADLGLTLQVSHWTKCCTHAFLSQRHADRCPECERPCFIAC